MISKSRTLITAAFVLLLGITGFTATAVATTPDGETPANEGVCDMLKVDGVTKGLYGLCVAYCEAQDLDSIEKQPPNTKILANYNKKKTDTDPSMPCVHAPCPCWTPSELYSITSDGIAGMCLRGTNSIRIIDNGPSHFAFVDTGIPLCQYVDTGISPITVNTQLLTSPADADACLAAVQQACADLGL